MTPENKSRNGRNISDLTPENKSAIAACELHLSRSPLVGHAPKTYLSAVRGYLAWLESGTHEGEPLNDATAKNWAARDLPVLRGDCGQACTCHGEQDPGGAR